jgi:hypothetical protein
MRISASLHDYQRLSRAIHGAGMYLVQDVVVNHVANYFGYPQGWKADDPSRGFVLHPVVGGTAGADTLGRSRSTMREIAAHRAAGIYHWTPEISDFADRRQELTFQLAGLDDLNTGNRSCALHAPRPTAPGSPRSASMHSGSIQRSTWSPAYFTDFLHADDPEAPGVLRVGRSDRTPRFPRVRRRLRHRQAVRRCAGAQDRRIHA